MIQVREVFQLHFGKAREAIELARQMVEIEERNGGAHSRILTDLTGEYYTLVLEADFDDLATFERGLQESMASPEFRELYPHFAALCQGGRREIYRVAATPGPRRVDAALAGGAVVAA